MGENIRSGEDSILSGVLLFIIESLSAAFIPLSGENIEHTLLSNDIVYIMRGGK
jgi:hypothetical protein